MTSQWIDVAATSGGKYGAYLSLPPAGKGPGLVLFQEIFGVNRHIRAVADQYALDGFVVLAPDLFWRDASRVELGYEGADRERALVLMKGADPKLLAEDIKTTVAALRARPDTAWAGASPTSRPPRRAWTRPRASTAAESRTSSIVWHRSRARCNFIT